MEMDQKLKGYEGDRVFDAMDVEKSLIKSIYRDEKAELVAQSKRLSQTFSAKETGGRGRSGSRSSPQLLDRDVAAKLLQLCCTFDAAECAAVLIAGEISAVPLINEMDEAGLSPLHTAAEMHSARCVELLLRKRARTGVKSKDGRAQLPLELSLFSTRLDVVWSPDDSIGNLLSLVRQKDLSAVRLLIEKTKEAGEVAHRCAMEGQIISLAILLVLAADKPEASILEKATIYESVVRKALAVGRAEMAPSKAEGQSGSERAEKRKVLLREIELLQRFGATNHSTTGAGTDRRVLPPLLGATQALDEAVVQIILDMNIDVNISDSDGNSALQVAIKAVKGSSPEQIRLVWLLLRHGARVGHRNNMGLTAIHIAAAHGNKEALQILLLEAPGSVNVATETKETPLFFAVKNDSKDCTELLLQWGANTEALNLRKQRPIDLAKSQDMRFILKSTNVAIRSYAISKQKNTLRGNEHIPETCEAALSMTYEDYNTERTNTKTEICRYFGHPGGCFRGNKCHFAHGEEELQQQQRAATNLVHSVVKDYKHKIFVGGLPPSLDSESLGKFFEEKFGSVEDATVIRVPGNHVQSRGFGFVTFRNKRSVLEAVEAHFVNILGRQVEIKSTLPKCILLTEFKKEPSQKQHEAIEHHSQALNLDERIAPAEPGDVSWVDKVIQGQGRKCPNNITTQSGTTSVARNMPAWLQSFKEWFPGFFSERLRGGEFYSLSSLKQDFRVTFGLDLDHASLGYPKLSDFMRSFSDICLMKVVPTGGHGATNHVVLVPNRSGPLQQLKHSTPLEYHDVGNMLPGCDDGVAGQEGSNDTYTLAYHNDTNRFDDIASIEDLLAVPHNDLDSTESSFREKGQVHGANISQADVTDTQVNCFQDFLKLGKDVPLSGQSRVSIASYGDDRSDAGYWNKENELRLQQKHSAFEDYAQMTEASLFLRELEFYKKCRASVEEECFERLHIPCQHLLNCRDCRLRAMQVACGAKYIVNSMPW